MRHDLVLGVLHSEGLQLWLSSSSGMAERFAG